MFSEDDLLPLSALQHLMFCERQCALIHIEGMWADNRLTVEGKRMHDRVHAVDGETRGGVHIARGVALRSLRLGLSGKADVVEFHRPTADDAAGVTLPNEPGQWQPFPVEYKRGRPKRNRCDEVQLCAQALCLEEMLDTAIPNGALFYGRTRRRFDVILDRTLREETERAAARLHALVLAGRIPKPTFGPHCRNCSLVDECLPKAVGTSARRYIERTIDRALAPNDTEAP